MTTEGPILEIHDVRKSFGGVHALAGCGFSVGEGEIVGLIGPNGSGKTTLFNTIVGYLPLDGGRILYRGEDVTGLPPYQIARKGIGRTFQVTRIFPKMTLLENVTLPTGNAAANERAHELLEFVGLADLRDEYASDLSFGQQRLLSIIQVLMLDPGLILLDEPAAGVSPVMQKKLLELIHYLNEDGRTFLIIEHNMDVVMNNCERVVVLSMGEKISEGSPDEVRRDEAVLTAYFGA
ncbi:MAG: ABC transporter ATP-binding protein [Nitrospinae bacterium]|nr:ABC transporter ATP-binding protein [Nitrospinota bacterium]